MLAALLVAGVCVGAGATALGADQLLSGEEDVAVTVGNEGVVVDGSEQRVALANTTWLTSIEVSGEDGRYTVETTRERPFTDQQRQTAVDLVRSSGSISLDDLSEYEVVVEPIQKHSADSAKSIDVGDVSETDGSFLVEDVTVEDDSVTVDREFSYVEEQLNVRVLGPDGELVYSVIVDLSVEEIVDVTVFDEPETETTAQ